MSGRWMFGWQNAAQVDRLGLLLQTSKKAFNMALTPQNFSTDQRGWTELLPARQASATLRGEHRVPWVVIGAGYTGLACARRLAQLHPQDDILLLDARQLAQGASGRNAGFAIVASQFPGAYRAENMPEYKRLNRINQAGVDLLRAQVEKHGIACDWDESGFHYGAADKLSLAECEHFLRYLDIMEVPHTRLDQQQLKAKLGTDVYKAGVHVPVGALVQPAALVYGLADSLPNNVTLYENSPVLKIHHGSQVELELEQASITADKVIIATNYEAGKIGFLKRYITSGTLAGSFSRVLTQDELSNLGNLQQWGVLSLHGGGATVRLTSDKRVVVRNTVDNNAGSLLSDRQLAERQMVHRESFERRFPQLAHVPFEYSWSGVEGITRNGTNFFGRQSDNIFLAGGYNGSGVSKGTAFGVALAEFASDGQSELINDCLASKPATWLPPRPFLDIGAAYTVASRFKGVGLDR